LPQDRQERHHRDRDPRRHGGERGAGQFEVQTEDQDRVEHGIHQPAPDRRHHRQPRGPMRAQDRAAHHADQQKRQGRNDDPQVPDGQVERLARGAQKAHQKGKVEPDNRAEDAAGQHTIHQCIGRAAAGEIRVIGPQRTRHQRAPGNRHADPDRGGEEQDRARRSPRPPQVPPSPAWR
jgi:hypothetical protein